ncbi:MAG: S8 family peptidase, partial [Candidatus Thorarchaeota archaeon]
MSAPLSYLQRKKEQKRVNDLRELFLQQLTTLRNQHESGTLSNKEYTSRKKDFLMGRSVESWILGYEERLSTLQQPQSMKVPSLAWVPVMLLIAVSLGLFLGPSFTGFVTFDGQNATVDVVNQVYPAGGSFTFIPSEKGMISGLSVSGRILGDGDVTIIALIDGRSRVLYTNVVEGLSGITGNVILNGNESNETVEVPAVNTTNETISNLINLDLTYATGTEWDANNDGIETLVGVIDFTVADTSFNWEVNTENLCTVWDIYNLDDDSVTSRCYGNEDCCSFAGLSKTPAKVWDDQYFLFHDKDGSGLENLVGAKVIHYAVDLDTLQSDIVSSEVASLDAKFEGTLSYYIEECGESCLISSDQSSFQILIESNGATVYLDNISYYVDIVLENVSLNVTTNGSMTLEDVDAEVISELEQNSKVRILVRAKDAVPIIELEDGVKGAAVAAVQSEGKEKVMKSDLAERLKPAKDLTQKQLDKLGKKKLLFVNTTEIVEVKQEVDGYTAIEVSLEDLDTLLQELDIEEVHIDEPFSTLTIDSVNITNIDIVQLQGYGGMGQIVCVLDTGVDVNALGMTNGTEIFGYNFVNDTTDYSDDHGHGTQVVYPLHQVAPDATLYVAKVIDASGNGFSSDVLAGLAYCEQNNATVISMSIGSGSFAGYCDDDLVAQKVNNLSASGILVVAATGNDGLSLIKSPACARTALPVAASEKDDTIDVLSNYNNATLLVAPGVSISTVTVGGSSVMKSGTSMAVPFVSGTAALVLENKSVAPADMKDLLVHTGMLINHSGRQFSRLDAYNALIDNYTNELQIGDVLISEGQGDNYSVLAAPAVSSVVLVSTPGNNFDTDNLTVTFTQTDSNTNVTDWRVNGTSIALVNMPFNKNVSSLSASAVDSISTYDYNGTMGNGVDGKQPVWVSGGMVGGAYRFDG